jgi:membrane dipeptidase
MSANDGESPCKFDFGLTDVQEARALRLHRESIVVDLLSQHAGGNIFSHYSKELQAEFDNAMASAGTGFAGFADAMFWPFEMSLLGKSDLLRDWLLQSGLTCGTHGLDVHDGHDPVANKWERLVFRYASLSWLRYVTTAAEIRQAKKDGVIAIYAHCQPVVPPPRDLNAFDIAYTKGLRSFMLTYNRMDNIGVGCTERIDAGLSMFGVDVIKHCNDIGMMIDVSHCGHSTTMDACRFSKRPVNANHTSARSIFPHARAKNDEALRAIAGTGGVIGVLAVPFFLTDNARPTIEHMLDHIDYIAGLVGWQHVAIGTDWPMQAPDAVLRSTLTSELTVLGFRVEDRIDVTGRLTGFDDCRDLPNITRGLVKRDYSDEQIRGILGENALRVFAEVCH